MIQANELRIGNLVEYKWFDKTFSPSLRKTIINREMLKVVSIDSQNNRLLVKPKHYRYNHTWFIIERFKGIPLTEEILLKCGFEKVNSSYEEAETHDYFLHPIYFDMTNNSLKINEVYQKINYPENLHQLQNLYFALIGKELEINL